MTIEGRMPLDLGGRGVQKGQLFDTGLPELMRGASDCSPR